MAEANCVFGSPTAALPKVASNSLDGGRAILLLLFTPIATLKIMDGGEDFF